MNKKITNNTTKKAILAIISLFITLSFAVFIHDFFQKTNFENMQGTLYNAGTLFGLIAFFSLSLLIISGELARFFDKYFGIDIIIKTQRKFSILVLVLAILHPTLFILSNTFWAKYLVPNFAIMPLAAGTIALYLLLIISIASFLYKKISQTMWQYLHIIIYALFFTASYHMINQGSSFNNNQTIQIIFNILLAGVLIGIIYRTQYKIRKYFKEKPRIKNIKQETHDTFTITITKPENFKYKAGQFAFLKLNKNKLYARHPFTISSAPHEKNIEFTIKNTGKFTETAKKLKKNEQINIEGPHGTFCANNNDDLIFIAGGVGITPFISIIKDKTKMQTKQKITMHYCSRTEKDIIKKKELDELQKQNKNLKIIHYLSQENKKGYERRLGKENFLKNLKILNQKKTTIMICGPEKLKKTIKKILKEENKKIKTKTESFFW